MSWVTPTSVSNPTVMVGTAAGGFGRKITAETRTYTDSNNGIQTIAQHARIEGLHPDTAYVYRIVSDGETQVSGAFRTGPEWPMCRSASPASATSPAVDTAFL